MSSKKDHSRNYALTGWVSQGLDEEKALLNLWNQFGEPGTKEINYIGGKLEETKKAGKHWQFWVQFAKVKFWGPAEEWFPAKQFHREVCEGTAAHNEKYCAKSDTQVRPFECYGAYVVTKGDRVKVMAEIERRVKEGATRREMWTEFFPQMVNHARNIEDAIDCLAEEEDNKAEYGTDEFTIPLIEDWSKSLLFWGESGIGKTQFALAHFKRPLFVSQLDELARFDRRVHDGIIFDDMDFSQYGRPTQLHLVDQDQTRAIKVRYKIARIPKHTKKIFTSNTREMFKWVEDDGKRNKALERRVKVHHFLTDLRKIKSD